MKIKVFLLILFSSFVMSSCLFQDIAELILKSKSTNKEEITYEEAERMFDLYWAIQTENVDKVREYLAEGYNPNRCIGEGWVDNTPLNVLVKGAAYDTYYKLKNGEYISDPPIDIAIFQMLVEAGADVNQRPYIWDRVHKWGNFILEIELEYKEFRRNWKVPETEEEVEELKKENEEAALYYVSDTNRLIEILLKAGADPDKKGPNGKMYLSVED